MMKERIEARRNVGTGRIVASVAMWGGWFGSAGLGLFAVMNYDPNHLRFAPQWVSLAYIFLVGVAIAGTSVVSRLKLAQTIRDAFEAGFQARGRDRDEYAVGFKAGDEQEREHRK
jgi:hypothetical protein